LKKRYFTKSLFKLALACPTKLNYTRKSEYKNEQGENAFLEALKDGGYQVGALAKAYIDGGVDLEGCDNEQAYQKTQELLSQEKVIIYEALFRHENMQVRCDILIKDGDRIDVIEVKSKSYSDAEDNQYRDKKGLIAGAFRKAKGNIISDWRDYLLDVAFQSYVIDKALPSHFKASYYLMLVDKAQACPVDGLNQKFIISKNDLNKKVKIISKPLTSEDKTPWLLKKIKIDQHIHELMQELYKIDEVEMSFDLYVKKMADSYCKDIKIQTCLGGKCKSCEFKSSFTEEADGLKSGFRECWKQVLQWQDSDFEDKTVLDLWKSMTKDKLIAPEKIKLDDINEDDLNLKEESSFLIQSARQWLQIEKYQANDNEPFIHPKLKEVMSKWVFPLHFIDFETCTVAIPIHKGRKAYEALAFQFSHHVMYEDGRIEHKGEYIETRAGYFPNYDFVRALKKELDQDEGTIFRFHNHENTILNAILAQIKSEPSKIEDEDILINFILAITKKNEGKSVRQGPRCMVDLEEILRKYTYFPSTDGRTSMKVTFPTVLRLSSVLQGKYSKPIYGTDDDIKSHNFKHWCVVEKNNGGEIIDPYSRLPGVFENVPKEDIELFEKAERMREIKEIKEGGMASVSYAMMQFTEMSDVERRAIRDSLLKYCEMDTLAMVILYEFLSEQRKGLGSKTQQMNY
jgi:hypothetical protein